MFRQYDPRIGRWLSIDPVTHEHQTPYSAFDGNPIYYSDPSGADGEDPKERQGFFSPAGVAITLPGKAKNIRFDGNGNLAGFDIGRKTFDARYNEDYTEFTGYYRSRKFWFDEQYRDDFTPNQYGKIKDDGLLGEEIVWTGSALTIGLITTEATTTSIVSTALASVSAAAGVIVLPGILSGDTDTGIPNGGGGTVLPVELPISIPFAVPIDFTDVDSKPIVSSDGLVTLFRGVPSDDIWGDPNPSYPPSVTGLAVPQGGSAGPIDANKGVPSNFTYWSIWPGKAFQFATHGRMGIGTVITIQVPFGMVFPNTSPDKYDEGEVQIPGAVRGLPTPVYRPD